jgi:hypothetical protein
MSGSRTKGVPEPIHARQLLTCQSLGERKSMGWKILTMPFEQSRGYSSAISKYSFFVYYNANQA